jgi:membrane protein YdbS with pleckstrin-like domain
MNCPQCYSEVPDNAVFCHRCGHRLADPPGEARPFAAIPAEGESSPPVSPRDKFRAAGNPGNQGEDDLEEEIWEGSYSPKAMISVWIGMALLTLIAIVGGIALMPATLPAWLGLFGVVLLVWLLLFLRLVYMRFSVRYRLTSQRFVHEQGILRRTTDRIEVIDIDDVAYDQSLIDRFVGVGTIRLATSDRSHAELAMKGIENVAELASVIDNARRRERVRRGLHIEAV